MNIIEDSTSQEAIFAGISLRGNVSKETLADLHIHKQKHTDQAHKVRKNVEMVVIALICIEVFVDSFTVKILEYFQGKTIEVGVNS